MLNYAAFFNGKQADIEAESLYGAKLKAIVVFKPRRSQEHLISVHLVTRAEGSAVVHTADF